MSMMDSGAPQEPTMPAMPEPAAIAAPAIMPAQVQRNVQAPEDESEANLVKDITKWCRDTKEFRSRRFAKMRSDMAFVRPGNQWRRTGVAMTYEEFANTRPYEVNITQRHIQQRVAALYAKNPTFTAKRKKRLDFSMWDGSQATLRPIVEQMAMAQQQGVDPMLTPEQKAMLMEIEQGMAHRKMVDRVAATLEVLFPYFMNEATPSFKVQAKGLVRRTITTGVAPLQLGFQRIMAPSTESGTIRDDTMRLRYLQTVAADVADGEIREEQKEVAELAEGIEGLQSEKQIVLREGLTFEFPVATDILVDRNCTQLKGLIGAKRVAREYHYTKREVEQIFGIDLGTTYTQYEPTKTWEPTDRGSADKNVACIWKVWDSNTGLVYHVADGFPAFLKKPEVPDVRVEQFFPFYFLAFNEIEDPDDIYPPSDVELIRPMQLEMNRTQEGLRQHRIGNKPGYVSAKGVLDDDDKKSLMNHAINGLIELNLPTDKIAEIEKVLAARPAIQIQPELYSAEPILRDFMLTSGSQEANLGPTSDSTATEASIAETSRVSSLQSNIDDLDEFLSMVARDAGSVLLAELSPEQATEIAGPGAVWPEMSREEIAQEIFLEVRAGSSGRPNRALEIANFERIMPLLIQLPGIRPEWIAKQGLQRLDDDLDLTDAFDMAIPSITAMNSMATAQAKMMGGGGAPQPEGKTPQESPNQQGGQGGKDAIGVPTSMPGPNPDFPVLPSGATTPVGGGPLTH